jgi:hypothetical protein
MENDTSPKRLTGAQSELRDIEAIARAVGCLTREQVCRLAKVTPTTEEAWRKRGTGPAYVRFGNTVLYPVPSLAEFLQAKLHKHAAAGQRPDDAAAPAPPLCNFSP